MKKILCFMLAGLLMLQTICMAAPTPTADTPAEAIAQLKTYDTFTETVENVLSNPDGKITRRDALEMIVNLFFAPGGKVESKYGIGAEQDRFVDVENWTYDCVLVKMAYGLGFLNGKEIDGKLYADLDSNITYYEALALISRLFRYDCGADDWYQFVCNSGIVSEELDTEKQNEEIPAEVFMEYFYRALYVPRTKYTYGGKLIAYYIDKLELSDELPAGGEEIDDTKAEEVLEQFRIVDTSLYEDVTEMPRYDALALLVRSIGMMVSVGFGSDYSTQFRPKQHVDFSDFDYINENFAEWYLGNRYARQNALYFASLIPDFVYGASVNEDGTATFNTDRAITTKEAVAFMVRLLNCPEVDKKDLEATYTYAFEIDLLKETDAFVQNPDAPLSPEEYFVILHRFLYQPKYIYYGSEFVHFATGGGEDYILTDEEGSENYFDYLSRVVPELLNAGALMSGSHLVTYE